MQQLAANGIRFALDDFGMEHSALSHLSDLPFDTLKIDRSFVSRMTEDRGHAALFQAIISMIHSLGMTAVAEGVEAPSQLIYLQAYGCDVIQGYLFSRPLPAEEFAPLLTAGMVVPMIDADARHGRPTLRQSRRGVATKSRAAARLRAAPTRRQRLAVQEAPELPATGSGASASAAPSPRSGGCARASPRTAGRPPPACGRCSCRCRSACGARAPRAA